MRATPDQRETSDLKQSIEEMEAWIVERTCRLVNTGCVIALVHPEVERQDEAKTLVLEINTAVQELEEMRTEITQRGH
jgi:hypothetical protein